MVCTQLLILRSCFTGMMKVRWFQSYCLVVEGIPGNLISNIDFRASFYWKASWHLTIVIVQKIYTMLWMIIWVVTCKLQRKCAFYFDKWNQKLLFQMFSCWFDCRKITYFWKIKVHKNGSWEKKKNYLCYFCNVIKNNIFPL